MKETLAGIDVKRVALYPDHGVSKIKRTLNYLSFAFFSTLLGPWSVSRPDVIFVYHPPLTVGLPAVFLSRLWGVPFVYQIQDLWPETLSATDMVKNEHVLKWIGVFARWIYNQAHFILVISPGFKRNLIEKGVLPEKVDVVSNWADTELFHPDEPDLILANKLGLADKFNVMFAGNIGKAQGLETVIEAAELLKDSEKIQFVFVGDGVALPDLKRLAVEKKLANIQFLGRYPAKAMSRLYALADVLLVHLNDDSLFQITIPHKILSYFGAGKPVLGALKGDGAQIITDEKAGITCPPQHPQALANAIRLLYELPADEREAMGRNALEAARTKYSRQTLVAEIEAVLRQAVEARN